jgi:four helix bundle protein
MEEPNDKQTTSSKNQSTLFAADRLQALGTNYFPMSEQKIYNLEERTLAFALAVRTFVKALPRTISNFEDVKQVVRSSGSVGANYLEANAALSKKDLVLRLRIARKEAKETGYWLKSADQGSDSALATKREDLVKEATELLRTLSAIISKPAPQ